MRWRRVVERELVSLDTTFTQWLVLDAADELIRETGDAMSQNAIAARAELDRTAQGKSALKDGRARAEAASKRLQQRVGPHKS